MIPEEAAKRHAGGRPKKSDKRVSLKIYVNSVEKAEIMAQADAAGLGLQDYARRVLMFAELPRPVPLANFEMWHGALSLVDELKAISAALGEDQNSAWKSDPLLSSLLEQITWLRLALLGVDPE